MTEEELGRDESLDELLEQVYGELHRRAANCMRGQPGDHTLQPTALINEVYLKLNGTGSSLWNDRTRFLATASRAMRQVLIDHARKRGRLKNEPPGERTPLDRVVVEFEEHALDLEALDAALERLAERDPTMARAVELRFFGGMSVDETASHLGMPRRTFERRWTFVRTWLYEEIK
jgi:RNA polymerase sigma-70 factor (ECF subfamily)